MRLVAALGTTLNMPVLAEGVEQPAQLSIVAKEGCSAVQGYLIGKPSRTLVDANEVRRIMTLKPQAITSGVAALLAVPYVAWSILLAFQGPWQILSFVSSHPRKSKRNNWERREIPLLGVSSLSGLDKTGCCGIEGFAESHRSPLGVPPCNASKSRNLSRGDHV